MMPVLFTLALGFACIGRLNWPRFALYLCALAMCIVAVITSEGMPRPRWTFLSPPAHAVVVASRLQEPTAIYLWLLQPGSSVPVAVRLPWNEGLAAQLQQATQDAAGMHGLPSMTTAHGKPMFGAGKIAPLPVKENGQ